MRDYKLKDFIAFTFQALNETNPALQEAAIRHPR
jgi:hypothetical protein